MKHKLLKRDGQFALEYILLFTAVIAVIATVLLRSDLLPDLVEGVIIDSGDVIERLAVAPGPAPEPEPEPEPAPENPCSDPFYARYHPSQCEGPPEEEPNGDGNM